VVKALEAAVEALLWVHCKTNKINVNLDFILFSYFSVIKPIKLIEKIKLDS